MMIYFIVKEEEENKEILVKHAIVGKLQYVSVHLNFI
jgi:hypothetical protein